MYVARENRITFLSSLILLQNFTFVDMSTRSLIITAKNYLPCSNKGIFCVVRMTYAGLLVQLIKIMMPHPVNPDLGLKIQKAIFQMKETIRKRPTKSQQILQNSQPNFVSFLFISVIPAFAFFSESIILQNGFRKPLVKRNIFFIIEKRVYVRKGSWEPVEQLSLSKPLVFRRGIKGACSRWVHYKRFCNNMG